MFSSFSLTHTSIIVFTKTRNMSEFTEMFPLAQQFDGLVHTSVYSITFDLPTLTILLFVLTSLFFIVHHIMNGMFFWVMEIGPNEHDLEEGNNFHGWTLPPLVNYGMHGGAISCGECAICLEEFQPNELCQVFPVCKHIFHSDCINHWLQRKLNCPMCRSCIHTDNLQWL